MNAAAGPWLEGKRVVVTAGGTREALDPIRFMGNRSSGKMGNALAAAAQWAGAHVTLITAAPPPPALPQMEIVAVETAQQMHDAVHAAFESCDLLIMAAAVADFRPAAVSASKVKKSAQPLTIALEPTVDILASLGEHPHRDAVFVVGFAAETDDLLDNARRKLEEKRLDLIVVNDISRSDIGMGADQNAVTVIGAEGVVAEVARAAKSDIAEQILNAVRERMPVTANETQS